MTRQSGIANAWTRLDRVQEALASLETSIRLTDRPEARPEHLVLRGNHAGALHRLGRAEDALRQARKTLQLAAGQGVQHQLLAVNVRLTAGVVASRLGALGDALQDLQQCIDDAQDQSERHVVDASQHQAWIWAVLGQPARALQGLRREHPGLSPTQRVRAWVLRASLQRWCGTAAPVDDELVLVDTVDAAVAAGALVEQALRLPTKQRSMRLQELATQWEELDHPTCALHARVWQLVALTEMRAEDLAARAVAVRDRLDDTVPNLSYRPEMLWLVSRALGAAGESGAARQAVADSWAEVQRMHDSQVPEPFRDSFLHRNRVNVAIRRAWAAGPG